MLLLLASLCCCGPNDGARPARHEFSGSALGTTYHVVLVVAHTDDIDLRELEPRVEAAIDKVDRVMSTWKSDSELSLFNRSGSTDWIGISESLFQVLNLAQEVALRTGGAFDITVGPLVDLWGFGATGPVSTIPSVDVLRRTRERVGPENLVLRDKPMAARKRHPGTRLDLSAIAKGYAVDKVAEYLNSAGIHNFLVEIGGELRASGVNDRGSAWRVAIEIPRPSGGVQALVNLQDMAIATSGDYRNYISIDDQQFSHSIDPRTGRPVTHQLASVTVLEKDAMTADAMATALVIMGPEEGFAYAVENDMAVYILVRNGSEMAEKITTNFSQYLEIID